MATDILPSWATVQDRPCVVVACSGCDVEPGDRADEGTRHWHSAAEARASLTADGYGWVVAGDELLCPPCAAGRACAAAGGHDLRPDDVTGLYRYCQRGECTYAEKIPDAEVDAELRAMVEQAGDDRD